MRLTPILLALGLVGCGDTVEKTVYIYRYPDAGSVADTTQSDVRPPEHGNGEGEGQSAELDAGSLDGRVQDAAADAAVSADATVLPVTIDHHFFSDYFRYGSERRFQAITQNAEKVVFELTNALGEIETITVPQQNATIRGSRAVYQALFPGVWNQPGVYPITATAVGAEGNRVSDSDSAAAYNQLVTEMPPALGVSVFILSYDVWKRDVLGSPLFRDIFDQPSRNRGETWADAILAYEQTFGQRVIDGREYTKLPVRVHIVESPDERGAVGVVYEQGNGNNYFANMNRLVFEGIGAVTTREQIGQILGTH
ncbi:MAG: hypothetical protein Q7R76_00305 [Candidatus Woesearchaeota archaeon]|nr:hypothetical protein [Candidatus Woesearchaeota archaeon]